MNGEYKVGEKQLHPIGTQGKRRTYIFQPCPQCLNPRWVMMVKGKPRNNICRSCASRNIIHPLGANSPFWKGGRILHRGGYILIRLEPDDFFYPMVQCTGYVFEHRLVVAQSLGRCLHPWEIVHHKRGYAKDDNRYPTTLQLVTSDKHVQITILENKIKKLEGKVEELQKEIRLLKWQRKPGVLLT